MSVTSLHDLTFNPNPVQKQFIESRARADLFSSRMGEGKSASLVWSTLYHTRHNPGAEWFLIRDTWENLQATTQKEFFFWFPPGIMGDYHAGKKIFTWASGVAEGSVGFLGMDAPEDATKLQSRFMAGFGMDEPSPAVGNVGIDELIFDVAMSRLRQQGMKWYGAKLAENNPDETHWTYKRFVSPGDAEFRLWQPGIPENIAHLPVDYYNNLMKLWAHRPDLVRRFVEGDFGFQQIGKGVTPQWSDKRHLAIALTPIPRQDLYLLWDFGHNPTCIITQKTPLGHWLILESLIGEGIGAAELIENAVRPLLAARYGFTSGKRPYPIHNIGDPAGRTGEQASTEISAVRVVLKQIGGSWRSGPVRTNERIEPLRSVLTRSIGDKGLVLVDRERAREVWQALRGGWHFHVTRTGITSGEPLKNIHSHPGDAMGYGAAVLFPMGRGQGQFSGAMPKSAGYFGKGPAGFPIGPGPRVPPTGPKLILPQ